MGRTIRELLGEILDGYTGKSGDIIRIHEAKRNVENFFKEREILFAHSVKKMTGENRKPGISSYSIAWYENEKIEMLVYSCLN